MLQLAARVNVGTFGHSRVQLILGTRHVIQCNVSKHMSADLTKGSFGHFSSFCVIKISNTSKISRFCMFLQWSQIASNM